MNATSEDSQQGWCGGCLSVSFWLVWAGEGCLCCYCTWFGIGVVGGRRTARGSKGLAPAERRGDGGRDTPASNRCIGPSIDGIEPQGGGGQEEAQAVKRVHVRCLSSLFHTPRTRGAPPQAHSFCSCTFRSYYSWRWSHPAYRFDSVGCILCRSPALGVQSSHRMPQTHR